MATSSIPDGSAADLLRRLMVSDKSLRGLGYMAARDAIRDQIARHHLEGAGQPEQLFSDYCNRLGVAVELAVAKEYMKRIGIIVPVLPEPIPVS